MTYDFLQYGYLCLHEVVFLLRLLVLARVVEVPVQLFSVNNLHRIFLVILLVLALVPVKLVKDAAYTFENLPLLKLEGELLTFLSWRS